MPVTAPTQCARCHNATWRTDAGGTQRVVGCTRFGRTDADATLLGLLLMDMATRMPCPAHDPVARFADSYLSIDLPYHGMAAWPDE